MGVRSWGQRLFCWGAALISKMSCHPSLHFPSHSQSFSGAEAAASNPVNKFTEKGKGESICVEQGIPLQRPVGSTTESTTQQISTKAEHIHRHKRSAPLERGDTEGKASVHSMLPLKKAVSAPTSSTSSSNMVSLSPARRWELNARASQVYIGNDDSAASVEILLATQQMECPDIPGPVARALADHVTVCIRTDNRL